MMAGRIKGLQATVLTSLDLTPGSLALRTLTVMLCLYLQIFHINIPPSDCFLSAQVSVPCADKKYLNGFGNIKIKLSQVTPTTRLISV